MSNEGVGRITLRLQANWPDGSSTDDELMVLRPENSVEAYAQLSMLCETLSQVFAEKATAEIAKLAIIEIFGGVR